MSRSTFIDEGATGFCGLCRDRGNALEATVRQYEQDARDAAGELMVSITDTPPGSLANKLVTANRIIRAERDRLRSRVAELEALTGDTARQLHSLSVKLACKARPSHIGYISKPDAAEWCSSLEDLLRQALQTQTPPAARQGEEE